MDQARIARFELPGKRWFFASCQSCRWVGLDWKDKEQARRDRDEHNTRPPHAALEENVVSVSPLSTRIERVVPILLRHGGGGG